MGFIATGKIFDFLLCFLFIYYCDRPIYILYTTGVQEASPSLPANQCYLLIYIHGI